MNEKAQTKWTGPDEINGVLHVGKGYRQAGMSMADRLRTDREQWYPGDGEKGENGIWGDARPGSFDPAKIYRVPVERKDEPGVHGDSQGEAVPPVVGKPRGIPYLFNITPGYRLAHNADRHRLDRQEWEPSRYHSEKIGWWGEANPGTYHPSKLYQVPTAITAASYPLKLPPLPPVGEFEDGGREGGPDYHPGECDAAEPDHLTAADFLPDDAVDHPSHYNAGPIECIDAIRAMMTADQFRAFCLGNVAKYIWRADHKGGTEDLRKAAWYLDRAIGEWWDTEQ